MTPLPEHLWLISPAPYVSAHIRYTWAGVLPYQKRYKRPGFPTFPALCVPAWLWTPYAALVCGVNVLQRVTGWARYFAACVVARWVLCQPSLPVLLARAGEVTLIEPRQLELPLAS